jgi:hypothetical protein
MDPHYYPYRTVSSENGKFVVVAIENWSIKEPSDDEKLFVVEEFASCAKGKKMLGRIVVIWPTGDRGIRYFPSYGGLFPLFHNESFDSWVTESDGQLPYPC